MNTVNIMPLALGLVIFSFLLNSLLVVPFINLLYRLRLTRRREAQKGATKSLFDKMHDFKAGTPIGGGILIIVSVTILFFLSFYFASYMGVLIRSAHNLKSELFLIFFTFLSFGLLGFTDDVVKIFGKGRAGLLGLSYGLTRKQKFICQWILAFIIGYFAFSNLGIKFLYIPFIAKTINLGIFYIPFAAFLIVTFANAYNFTDGLDGLAGGLLMIFLISFGLIAAQNLDTPLWIFITLWLGALMAFLYFNVYPARIFLGDAGALSFGATIAVIGLLTGGIFALVVIGGIFLIEIASSFIQILGWKFLKRPLFPMAPIHHALQVAGWEEPKIVMRAWLAAIMLAVLGLWLSTI